MIIRTSVILLVLLLASFGELDAQICLITNPAQPFSIESIVRISNTVTLTWGPTCTNYAFGVFSIDQLSSNAQYQARAGMWGNLSGTSQFTDTGVTNRMRFYKVLRIQPTSTSDWDGDGIPDVYELQYGLNPFDPGDATNDLDSDGYSNFDEFLMGSNPTNASDPITLYVDAANTNGTWDGSQANPFRSIQDAIESSVDINSNLAIRVRPGKYYEPVSNLQYDPYSGDLVSTRQFLFIYGANTDWSLSTDPESHIIDTLGFQHRDLLLFSGAPSAPAVEFNGVTRARINGFTLRGGQGPDGGGILAYSTNGPIYISNCIIEKNGGNNTEAGGIFIQAATNSMIYNTVIAKNTGTISAILDVNGSQIWNCTIVSNVAVDATLGAVTGDLGAPNVRNSIIWNGGIDLDFVNADYSSFGSNVFSTVGLHNLSDDPQLVNVAFGNYRLQVSSPMLAAGTVLPIEQMDLYGNPRPLTGRFDIGANEYKDSLGDGIQDDWKIKNGLSLTTSQASLDPDGDGLSNLQEYNSHSNPNNPDTDGDGISDGPTVPPGSGLQPGPDPDPTTPDLVLNTIYWDYFYSDTFLMYINGTPQWINEPPSSPRQVVLNGFHVGSHVTFQWQVIDDETGEPFLVFYVPHTTFGNIIPDVDATPLNQIQFGFGDFAPPDGPWGFTIAKTDPTNADICAGFDDVTPTIVGSPAGPNPWLSLSNGGTNSFTLVVDPTNVFSQIIFSSALGHVNILATSTNSHTALVQVFSLSTNSALDYDDLLIKGVGAQNTFTTTCASVNLDLLPSTNVTVAIHEIIDSGVGAAAPTNVPSASELQSYYESVFGQQANVHITVLPLTTNTFSYDINHNHLLDVREDTLTGEQAIITGVVYNASAALNIYFVNGFTNLSGGQIDGIEYPSNVAFIQDSHLSTSVNLTAHETGHFLGLDDVHTGDADAVDRLMYVATPTNPNPCRLLRDEWRAANKMIPLP